MSLFHSATLCVLHCGDALLFVAGKPYSIICNQDQGAGCKLIFIPGLSTGNTSASRLRAVIL